MTRPRACAPFLAVSSGARPANCARFDVCDALCAPGIRLAADRGAMSIEVEPRTFYERGSPVLTFSTDMRLALPRGVAAIAEAKRTTAAVRESHRPAQRSLPVISHIVRHTMRVPRGGPLRAIARTLARVAGTRWMAIAAFLAVAASLGVGVAWAGRSLALAVPPAAPVIPRSWDSSAIERTLARALPSPRTEVRSAPPAGSHGAAVLGTPGASEPSAPAPTMHSSAPRHMGPSVAPPSPVRRLGSHAR